MSEEMVNQCEHSSPEQASTLCKNSAEIAALRAEVDKLRGYLQDAVRVEAAGDGLTVTPYGSYWEIDFIGRGDGVPARVTEWPCSEKEFMRAFVKTSLPGWVISSAMNLAERWRAAFGDDA